MYLQVGKLYLRVLDLQRFERTTVWSPDKVDLLSVRNTLGVVCTYSPGGMPKLPSVARVQEAVRLTLDGDDDSAALAARFPRGLAREYLPPVLEDDPALGGDSVQAPPGVWHNGPETDAELIVHLRQPRQRTILWAYSRQTGKPIRWLETPRPGFTEDLTHGPRPIACDVIAAQGEPTSTTIYYEVESDMSPCPSGADRLVLSHRWEMTHQPDPQTHHLARIVKGQIVFNGAILALRDFQPDWVRNQLLHPIPVGMERKPPVVTLSADGLTLRYTIIDVDPTITFDPGNSGATTIDIQEQVQYNVPKSTMR